MQDLITVTTKSIGQLSNMPVERVKLLWQVEKSLLTPLEGGPFKGYWDVTRRVYNGEGLLSFWKGGLVKVFKVFPQTFLMLFTKDSFSNRLKPALQSSGVSPKKTAFVANFVSGGLAGGLNCFLIYPLDYLRVAMATNLGGGLGASAFTGYMDCIKKTLEVDGVRGFYRGFLTTFAGIFAYRAFYFGFYDLSKLMLNLDDQRSGIYSFLYMMLIAQTVTLAAGGIALPFEVIKNRLMLQACRSQKQFTGFFSGFSHILRNEGVKSLFRGFWLQVYRGVISAVALTAYDAFRPASSRK